MKILRYAPALHEREKEAEDRPKQQQFQMTKFIRIQVVQSQFAVVDNVQSIFFPFSVCTAYTIHAIKSFDSIPCQT